MNYQEALEAMDRMPDCVGTYKRIKNLGFITVGAGAGAMAAERAKEAVMRQESYCVVYMAQRSMAEGGAYEIGGELTYPIRRNSCEIGRIGFYEGSAETPPNGRSREQHKRILDLNNKSKRSYLK